VDTESFLKTVVTQDEGFFCMPLSHEGQWLELWHHWPQDMPTILERTNELKDKYNVHFSSYLFSAAQSDKEHALPSRTIQADLDNADPSTLPIEPTVLVQTSPNRYHGYWVLDQQLKPEHHERLSRKLTYSIPLCDRSGWPIAKKLRIPDTYNYKYTERPPVSIVHVRDGLIPADAFDQLPMPPNTKDTNPIEGWLELSQHTFNIGPHELLETIKGVIPSSVYNQYSNVARDRSSALWALMCAAFRVGLPREAVFWLAKHSANNKFIHLKYGADRELAKDVIRAEEETRKGTANLWGAMNEMRRSPGNHSETMQGMFDLTLTSLQSTGTFLHSTDNRLWYMDRETGKPIILEIRSDDLDALLDKRFKLNAVEQEQRYIVKSLANYAANLPATSIATSLSYYNEVISTLYIHTGRKNIIKVKADSISEVDNGDDGIIFPWVTNQEVMVPDYSPLPDGNDWATTLFGKSVNNVISLPRDQAVCLYRVWLLFLLFRHASVSRPIIAIFGQPGSGKSTLFRKVYALLYGSNRSVGAVTTADNFDYSVANDPFVVLDNVDTFERWLPDRLALSASTSDIVKRKLYTNSDIVILRRQALVGVTAHAPKFGREDVADRLLPITLERLTHFESEGSIIREILSLRNKLWGSIIRDCQTVLSTPMPTDYPQFRVEDFAHLGYWIASALGQGPLFKDMLAAVRTSQRSFATDEDSLIVGAIFAFLDKSKKKGQWLSPGQLWSELELYSGDPVTFKKVYRNAQDLGKKLWTLQDALRDLFTVDQRINASKGAREWLIGRKDATD
jgi:hypothetical protein